MYISIIDYFSAKRGEQNINDRRWTRTHAFFADIGGFRVRELRSTVQEQDRNVGERELKESGINGSVYLEAGGDRNPSSSSVVIRSGKDSYKWFELNQSHIDLDYERLRVEIEGASNADSFLKTLTCIQAAWLIIQTIVRAAEHRPVSPLEVTTCGYVVCTLIAYYFWWDKPYGMQTHVLLHMSPIQGPVNQDTDPTPFNRTASGIDDISEHHAL